MFDLVFESEPFPADLLFIEEQINAFNMSVTGYYDYQPLAILVRDEDRQIIAGLTGFSWGKCCVIGFLWVNENHRKCGYGTALMQQAEEEARRRNCIVVIVGTHSFQAPEFYPRLGYTIVGTQEDFPAGYRHDSFSKRLTEALDVSNPQQEVLIAEQAWTQAHLEGDFAAIERMMADDYTRINPDGSLSNKTETLAAYTPEQRQWQIAQSDQHTVRINGDTATVTGRWAARGVNNGQAFDYQARFLSVYVRRNRRWQMLAEQSTEIR